MSKNIIFSLILFSFILANPVFAQHINQAGYIKSSVKRVFFPAEFQNKSFHIENENGKQVFTGATNESKYWDLSGTSVCFADFSSVSIEGSYTLIIDGLDPVSLIIDDGIYEKIAKDATKMFYHARISMPIEEKYAGKYARPAGHPDNEVLIHASAASQKRPEGSTINSPGGWYDAGDYNKYIVNSSITTYTLLHAAEMYNQHLSNIQLNIPESGNGVPDLLDETLYNLRWMLTMQDPNDGGVYHKLTTKKFCGMIAPHEDKNPRYVVMKTTAATLDFAATMAKAYRVLKPYEKDFPGLAEECKSAAIKAWKWSIKNPSILYEQPTDISTGKYGGKDIADEWLWASTELYLSTKEKKYIDNVDFSSRNFDIPSWGSVATLSLYSILNSDTKNTDLKELASNSIMKLADKYYTNYKESAYKVSATKFPWGSNGDISNQGMLFLNSYKLTGDKKYLEAADACLAYILGANPTAYCFVTGYGTLSPKHIHERRSISDGIEEPLPGFLAGGPTLQAQRDCGKEKYPTEYPATSYLDEECSYSTNEIAINWNAPFAYLLWGLDAELRK